MKIQKIIILVLFFSLSAFNVSAKQKIPSKKELISYLESWNNFRVKNALMYIQSKKDKSIIPLLKQAIKKSRKENKSIILLQALSSFDIKKNIDIWIEKLEQTKSDKVKLAILKNIKNIKDRKLVLPLTFLLNNPETDIRKLSAKILRKTGDDRMFPFILQMGDRENSLSKIKFLSAMEYLYDKRFFNTIISYLSSTNKTVQIYTLKLIYINKIHEALPQVRKLLSTNVNNDVKIEAIKIIGKMKDYPSQYLLAKCLGNQSIKIRKNTALALKKLKSHSTIYSIYQRLKVEKNDEIKDILLDIIIAVKKTGNISALNKILLGDKNFRLRIKAAYSLGVIKDFKAIKILEQGLKDSDYRVRAETCNSLGKYKNLETTKILLKQIKDDSVRYVRSAALFELEKFRTRNIIIPLFNQYTEEYDIIFKAMLKKVLVKLMKIYL